MPGLYGIYGKNLIQKSENFEAMTNCLMHESWYSIDKYAYKNLKIGRVHQNIFNKYKQPITTKDGDYFVFIYGKIYHNDGDVDNLIDKGYNIEKNNDAEYVLYSYIEFGDDFVNNLNGSFTIAIFEKKSQTLKLINDRFGLRPIYYFYNKDVFAFSPEIQGVLCCGLIPKELNIQALFDYFYYGQMLADETLVENIKLLSPGSILKINSKNEISIKKYYNFNYNVDYSINKDEYVEILVDVWQKAVNRHFCDNRLKYGVALSGGLDSRSIVAAINSEYLPSIYSFTFGDSDSGEVKIASEVAKALDINHDIIKIKYDKALEFVDYVTKINGGLNSPLTSIILYSYHLIKDKVDVVFDGLAGDTLLGGEYLDKQLFKLKTKDDFKKYIRVTSNKKKIFSEYELKKLFYNKFNVVDLKEKILDIFNFSTTQPFANEWDRAFMYDKRVIRLTLLGDDQMRSQFEEATPTFDNNFVEIVQKIPPEFRYKHVIYREFFIKLNPKLAAIKYLSTGFRVESPLIFWRFGRTYQRLLKGINYYSLGLVKIPIKLNAFDTRSIFVKNKLWIELAEKSIKLLPNDLMNIDYSLEILNGHVCGKIDNTKKIEMLIAFSQFYNKYLK